MSVRCIIYITSYTVDSTKRYKKIEVYLENQSFHNQRTRYRIYRQYTLTYSRTDTRTRTAHALTRCRGAAMLSCDQVVGYYRDHITGRVDGWLDNWPACLVITRVQGTASRVLLRRRHSLAYNHTRSRRCRGTLKNRLRNITLLPLLLMLLWLYNTTRPEQLRNDTHCVIVNPWSECQQSSVVADK